MYWKKLIKSSFLFLIIFFFCSNSKVWAASIGVSPGGFYNEYLKPGSSITQEFIISRGNPDSSIDATLEIEIEDGHSDWISVEPGLEVDLPAGTQRVPFSITLNVPNDANYGKYEGSIRVLAENDSEGQVVIQPAIRLDINFIVTDKDIRLFEVHNSQIQNFNSGDSLILLLDYTNKGNVESSPNFVQIEIYNQKEEKIDVLKTENVPAIKPFERDQVEVVFENVELEIGTYIGEVLVKNDDEVLLEDRSIFTVYEGDDDSDDDESLASKFINGFKDLFNKNLSSAKEFIAKHAFAMLITFAIAVVLLIFILFFLDRKKDDKDSKD
jgi:hypothetical protein